MTGCSHFIIELSTLEKTNKFLVTLDSHLHTTASFYYIFLDVTKRKYAGIQSWKLFQNKFFDKETKKRFHIHKTVTQTGLLWFQVLNAVLFQPVSESSYHIYYKNITETIPEHPYNLWTGKRFLFTEKTLFPDKLSNFGGKVLQATSFQLAPFTYQNADGSRGGWEYRVMSALAKKLNFKLNISPPPNGELWGENKNGTFTGKII